MYEDKAPPSLSKNNVKGLKFQKFQLCMFFLFLASIYGIMLKVDNDNIALISTNIVINGLIAFGVLLKYQIIDTNMRLILVMVAKSLTLITLCLTDERNLFLVLYIFENTENEPSKYLYIEQITMKIGSLIVICYKSHLVAIIIISSILLLYLIKIAIAKADSQEEISHQVNLKSSPQPHQILEPSCSHISRQTEEIWKNRMQILPISMVVVSMKNLEIIYKNQCFYNYFSQFCNTEVELVDLVMNKLNFRILNSVQQNEEVSSINEIIQKKIKKSCMATLNNNSYIIKNQETLFEIPQAAQSLNDILQNFKSKNLLSYLIFPQIQQFELNCEHWLGDGRRISIFGQIVQNEKDDEIIIFLNDISNQNELQQNVVIHNFKSKILQSFSHELRTPLNSALNFLQSSFNETMLHPSIKKNFIEPAYYSLRIQSFLINDIIDFSTFYQDQIALKRSEFTIQELVSEISLMFNYQFSNKSLAFDVDLRDNSLTLFNTDYNKLLQILINLIQNSLKYSYKGGCIVKLSSSQFSSSNLQIQVTDQGLGIKKEILPKLAKISETVEKRKDFVKDWSGIGLLISSILLQKLGPTDANYFDIQSEENKGTTITFQIQNHIRVPNSFKNIKCSTSNYMNFGSQSSQAKLAASQQIQVNSSLYNVLGTVVKNTEFHLTTNQYKTVQYPQYPSKKSQNDSMFSESNDDYLEKRLDDLENFSPFLITDINNVYDKLRDKNSKIINLQYLKQCEEKESEIFITGLVSNKKCNCMRILSVDDEIFNQKSLQMLISKLGFEVLLAYNGLQALQIVQSLQKCCPSCNLLTLILMDYQMPIMDGIETTQQLIYMMNNQSIPQIHIVGLTAFTNKSDIQCCINAGMSDVLSKPFDLKEFKKILVYIYNEYRQQ